MDWLVKPRRIDFNNPKRCLSEVSQVCSDDERGTQLVNISEIAQVLLSPKTGRTINGGLRFNTESFRQLCSLIGGSLMLVFNNVWSTSTESELEKRNTLIRVFNNLVKLQFTQLESLRFVVAGESREIVGLVSRKYQRVPNIDLIHQLRVGVEQGRFKPLQARLYNRDLFLLLSKRNSSIELRDGKWSQGLSVYNSETTKSAIYIPQAVFDSQSRSYSIFPESKENRIIHRKTKGFHQSLDAIVQTAMGHALVRDFIADGVVWRSQPVVSDASIDASVSRIKKQLVKVGFGVAVVERVEGFLRKSDAKVITRRMLYTTLLRVADLSSRSNRQLRSFANKTFLKLEELVK